MQQEQQSQPMQTEQQIPEQQNQQPVAA
jgi:hypothetical protein